MTRAHARQQLPLPPPLHHYHHPPTTPITPHPQGSWIKPGAVIIDVGTNPIDDPSKKLGYRLVGDCDFDDCRGVAGAITCVPGGVGPMTIAMLLRNTLTSAERFYEGKAGAAQGGGGGGGGGLRQPHWSTVVLGTLAGAAVVQGVVRRVFGGANSSSSKPSGGRR